MDIKMFGPGVGIKRPPCLTLQADEIRRKTEERRYQKMADAARRKEQELQRKAEQEVIERFNKKSYMTGATIDWNVVEI